MWIICAVVGLWCAATPPNRVEPYYDDKVHVVLPIEAFGANWRIQNYRKKVRAPSYFDLAMSRAISEAKQQTMPVAITVAPVNYRSNGIDLRGFRGSLLFGKSMITIDGSLTVSGNP